jgi:hypothetical protein
MESNYNSAASDKLKWVERIARLMDSVFKIPGTKFRFGLDPIIGLIPVAGELATFAVSGGLVLTMIKNGASRKVIILMIFNVLTDAVFGSIPFIGNIFDFAYRANDRNIQLLRKHYVEGRYQGSGNGILITVAIVFVVVFGLLLYGLYWMFTRLWDYFNTLM